MAAATLPPRHSDRHGNDMASSREMVDNKSTPPIQTCFLTYPITKILKSDPKLCTKWRPKWFKNRPESILGPSKLLWMHQCTNWSPKKQNHPKDIQMEPKRWYKDLKKRQYPITQYVTEAIIFALWSSDFIPGNLSNHATPFNLQISKEAGAKP